MLFLKSFGWSFHWESTNCNNASVIKRTYIQQLRWQKPPFMLPLTKAHGFGFFPFRVWKNVKEREFVTMAREKMYELAFQYKDTKLWQRLYDDEMFAVRLTDCFLFSSFFLWPYLFRSQAEIFVWNLLSTIFFSQGSVANRWNELHMQIPMLVCVVLWEFRLRKEQFDAKIWLISMGKNVRIRYSVL